MNEYASDDGVITRVKQNTITKEKKETRGGLSRLGPSELHRTVFDSSALTSLSLNRFREAHGGGPTARDRTASLPR